MTRHVSSALAIAALLCACGDDDQASPTAPSPTPATPIAAAEPPEPDGPPDPCALLTEAVVRATFEVPEETAIAQSQSTSSTYSVCSYTWDKPNADEIREEIAALQRERVQKMLKKARGGQLGQGMMDLAMNMPRMESQVSLNFGPPRATAEEAHSLFESAMSSLEQGITHRIDTEQVENANERVRAAVEGQEVTFQADVEPLEGVGDEARFIPRLNQVAVRDGNRILYVVVEIETEAADNLEPASRLARTLIAD